MKCDFVPVGDGSFRCRRCQRLPVWPNDHSDPARIHATCRLPGVGDWAAYYLAWFGLTKDRVRRVKGWLGLQRKCGCQERQETVNRWGHRLRRAWARNARHD